MKTEIKIKQKGRRIEVNSYILKRNPILNKPIKEMKFYSFHIPINRQRNFNEWVNLIF